MKKLNTDDFWDSMCKAAFYRIDWYSGKIYGEVVYTDSPPESVEGFINSKINCCLENLNMKPKESLILKFKPSLFSRIKKLWSQE